MLKSALALILFSGGFGVCARAQVISAQSTVTASGTASVYVPPDTAQIDVTMTATAPNAAGAASKDATQVAAVQAALTKLLGTGANIKTVNYSVSPVYNNQGQPNGNYTASSTLEVTLSNLTLAGTVIDTAVGAGATSVGGVQFTLQNSDTAHNQALVAATVQAVGHANAMATALSRTIGAVITIQETGALTPIYATGTAPAPGGGVTTVTPGLIQVQVSVTLQAQLN